MKQWRVKYRLLTDDFAVQRKKGWIWRTIRVYAKGTEALNHLEALNRGALMRHNEMEWGPWTSRLRGILKDE